jgi:hypothetical protein
MKFKVESYIENNRDQLDIERPDEEQLWTGITYRMDKRKSIRLVWTRVAASVLLVITVGSGIFLMQRTHDRSRSDDFMLASISHDLAEKDSIYRAIVKVKLNEVESEPATSGDLQKLKSGLNELDDQYAAYLSDIRILGDQPKIVNGIFRCYELKLRLIENTLYEIQKRNRYENTF